MRSKKVKKQYPENGKTMAGFFLAPFTAALGTMGAAYMGTYFSEYAGIDSALGKTGYAVAFSTLFLIVTRIIDMLDDPLQSWIIDSAKEVKFGKYRMFGILGVVLVTIGMVMLFGIPGFAKGNVVILWIWCLLAYLILESGLSFAGFATPLMQKVTTDSNVRAKLTASSRMGSVIAAIPFIFYVPLISVVGSISGNLGAAATQITMIFAVIFSALSLLGILLLKEPYVEKVGAEYERLINAREIKALIKTDVPLWVHCIALFVGNLAWGLAGAMVTYIMRWNYCADLVTGEVDLIKFAGYTSVLSVLTLIPSFLCPFLLAPILKWFKSTDRCMRSGYLIQAVVLAIITIGNLLGIMSPVILMILTFAGAIPAGINAMMMVLMTIECADYAEYKLGRNMTAMVNSVYNIANKGSSIIGGAIPGALLAYIGYSVNEVTGAFAGDLSVLPKMLEYMKVFVGPIPLVIAIAGYLIYKFFYKITPELRTEMTKELEGRRVTDTTEGEV